VSTADQPIGDDELGALFEGLETLPGLVIAVSGGPDSTALLVLAARWAKRLGRSAPRLLAATVDHGLRRQSAAEAAAVRALARRLGVSHRTLRWRGKKPQSGLQEAARAARYGLLAQAARRAGYAHILTGHTLDDQAETVLLRLTRGSGLAGLRGMASPTPLPFAEGGKMLLVRPFLAIAKSRLVATLQAAAIAYSEDPSNLDPRFTRARLRALMPALRREGLDAPALARLAARLRRADCAIECAVEAAQAALVPPPWPQRGPVGFAFARFAELPAEVGLRLLARAIAHTGSEGPVELGKLEALYAALRKAPRERVRRTLAGALVTLCDGRLTVERAPARRTAGGPQKR